VRKILLSLLAIIFGYFLFLGHMDFATVAAVPQPPSSCGRFGEPPCAGGNCVEAGLVVQGNKCLPYNWPSSGGGSSGGGGGGGGGGSATFGGGGGSGGGADPFCPGGNGINTAIGCIPINSTSAFVSKIFNYLMGIFGAVALVMMGYGSFLITTSAGNQEKVKAGKELITGAVSGLLFIIFSMFLLRLIGVDILKLPGLG
jgi:hypothetical protein